jgi:hypothetical protein
LLALGAGKIGLTCLFFYFMALHQLLVLYDAESQDDNKCEGYEYSGRVYKLGDADKSYERPPQDLNPDPWTR